MGEKNIFPVIPALSKIEPKNPTTCFEIPDKGDKFRPMKNSGKIAADTHKMGILIPVYNAATKIPELLEQLAIVCNDHLAKVNFRVLLVDDGSVPPLPKFEHPGLEISQIAHQTNRGKGASLRAGFNHFMQDPDCLAVITLDGDLQHPPDKLPLFVSAFLKNDTQLVIGNRKRSIGAMPFHRIISNTLTSFIISLLTGRHIYDSQCGFRLYSREVISAVENHENRFHFESDFLVRAAWKGFSMGFVSIPTIYNGAPSAIRKIPDTLNFIAVILRLIKERILGYV